MKTAISHLRANAIAYLALFVALGGTSYAAFSIPAGSVGTRQLRNGAVTRAKLNSGSIAGSVVFWAKIARGGQVIASSESATTSAWATGTGQVVFRGQVTRKCFGVASSLGVGGFGSVDVLTSPSIAGREHLQVIMLPAGGGTQPGPLAVAVAVICPN